MRCLVLALALAATPVMAGEVRINGPDSPLGGAAILPDGAKTIAVVVPGSGPTDRDGNSPNGLDTDAYKLLAQGLGQAGIASVRIDKRGMFTSASEGVDPNKVTVAGLAGDIRAWAKAAAGKAETTCA